MRRGYLSALWTSLALITLCSAGCGAPSHPTMTTMATKTPATTLNWKTVSLPSGISATTADVAVSPVDGHDAWLCSSVFSDTFAVWATQDAGVTWQRVGEFSTTTSESATCALQADETSNQALMAVLTWGSGEAGTLRNASLFSSNGGRHWSPLAGYIQAQELATVNGGIVALLNDTAVSQQGDATNLVFSDNGFASWRLLQPDRLSAPFLHFWLASTTGALVASSFNDTVWRTDDLGARWTQISTPDEQTGLAVWLRSSDKWQLCGWTGDADLLIHCSDDLGAHWTTTQARAYTSPCAKCGIGVTNQTTACPPSNIAPDGSLLALCPDDGATPGASSVGLYRLPIGASAWQRIGVAPGALLLVPAMGPIWCVVATPDQRVEYATAQLSL